MSADTGPPLPTAAPTAGVSLLSSEQVGRLGRLRLALRGRVDGRYAGAHRAHGHGSSQDVVDVRPYAPGDDPRLLDPHAWARHRRLLVRLFAAEDSAALRVVLDCSASMGFGRKRDAAAKVAHALVVVATSGGDRVRLVCAGGQLDVGPWYARGRGLAAAEARLHTLVNGGAPDLGDALRRARGGGPRGPVVLVSDLLLPGWEAALAALGTGGPGGDAVLVHLLGRADLEPTVRGDLRLADSESGDEVELGIGPAALARHGRLRDRWLDDVRRACGARGIAYARHLDDEPIEPLLSVTLPRLGLVS